MRKHLSIVVPAFLAIVLAATSKQPDVDWPAYGGGPEGIRYSTLSQINRGNAAKLHVAWSYDTADGKGDPQTQPIEVNGVLYGLTPTHKLIALDASDGKLLWQFDSGLQGRGANRSVVYWAEGSDRRIFTGVQSFIYAVDARTGKVIRDSVKTDASTCVKVLAAILRSSPSCLPVPASSTKTC